MSLRNQLCAVLEALESANLSDTERLLNAALQHYSQVKAWVLENLSAQWDVQWPPYLPSDLSDLCRDRLVVNLPDPDVSEGEVGGALWQWHHELFRLLEPFCRDTETPSTQKKALCGFNFVNDVLFPLANPGDLNRLIQAWGTQVQRPQAIKSPGTLGEALACLLYAAQHPDAENKFYIRNPGLLKDILAGAGPNGANLPSVRSLGGAAGNSAYVLSNLGIEVDVCCLYHSDVLEWDQLGDGNAWYLDFNANPPSQRPVQQAQADLPAKETVGFQFIPSPPWTWQAGQNTIQVRQPSRALFVGSDPSSPQNKRWNQVVVRYNGQRAQYPPPTASPGWRNRNIWPYPPLFCRLDTRGQTLEIHPTDPRVLSQRAQNQGYAVAILKEAGRQKEPDLMMEARNEQLAALQKAGIPIHVELSAGSNLGLLKESLSSGRWSVSLNQDDLIKLTGRNRKLATDQHGTQAADPFLFASRRAREGLFKRFLRAKYLLRILNARWIYVHGNELDIAVWQPVEEQQLGERLRDAMLLAKTAVVAAMIMHNTPPGLIPLVMDHLRGSTLAPKGFCALFEFVMEFVPWITVRYSLSPAASQQVRQDFLSLSGNCGWFETSDFGVAVTPVFWPDVSKFLNATGAGDYSSAVVAAYVWG